MPQRLQGLAEADAPGHRDPAASGLEYPPTLADAAAEARFRAEGYVVVDLLDGEALAELQSLCAELHPVPQSTWQSDFYDPDPGRKRRVHVAIEDAFRGPIEAIFADHASLLHNFVLNWPGPDGGLQLHQHSSIVDESRFRSALIWCALNDATEENGTLHVVPRSHRLQVGPRPERSASWLDGHVELLLDRHLVSVPIRAGQAIVFDNQLLHCSFPNRTDACRRTAAAVVIPTAATPSYFDPGVDQVASVYRLDPEHFFDRQATGLQWVRPDGLEPIGTSPWAVPTVTVEDLDALLPPGTCRHVPGDA